MGGDTTVIGRVDSVDAANVLVEALIDAHVPPGDVAVLVRTEEGVEQLEMRYRNGAMVGLPGGAALGALGAALGAPSMAAGPLGAGAVLVVGAGAIFGATVGGFSGLALWDWTLEEVRVEVPQGVLVAVRNGAMLDRAEEAMGSLGATRVRRVRESPRRQRSTDLAHLVP